MPSEEQLRQELAQAVRRVEKHKAKNRRDDPLPTMQDITAKYGASYREMIHEVRETLAGFDELFPQWKDREVELAGFVWFQGWNDLFDGAEQRYAENLRHLIDDVREDLGVADLPVVVAAMGQNGAEPAKGAMKVIQDAQLGMPSVPGYEHSVRAFATDELQDEAAAALYPEWKERQEEWQRVGSDRPYHYLGSAIWFSRIGFRMADEMLALLGEK